MFVFYLIPVGDRTRDLRKSIVYAGKCVLIISCKYLFSEPLYGHIQLCHKQESIKGVKINIVFL